MTDRPYDYWSDTDHWEIEAGPEPFMITVPLTRAGAVRGQVLHADGSPAADANVRTYVLSDRGKESLLHVSGGSVTVDSNGEFAIPSLPLDQNYRIRASIGLSSVQQDVTLNDREPIAQVLLTLPPGLDVSVLVLQPDGNPAAGVPLQLRWPCSRRPCRALTTASV